MKRFLAMSLGLIVSFAVDAKAQVMMNVSSPAGNGYQHGDSGPSQEFGPGYFGEAQNGAGYGAGHGAGYGAGCGADCGADCGFASGEGHYGASCGSNCGSGSDCGNGCGNGCGAACGGCLPAVNGGCYLKAFGGWASLEDFETFNQQFQVDGTFDDGFGVGAAWGHKIRPRWNFECEFTYRDNSADQLTAQTGTSTPIVSDWEGDISTYAGMTNLVFESFRTIGRLTPYCGAGAGFGFVDASVSTLFGDYTIDDSGFAFQYIGGVSRPISCRCDAFVEYRYFAIEDNRVENIAFMTVDDFDYRTNNMFFGVRLRR